VLQGTGSGSNYGSAGSKEEVAERPQTNEGLNEIPYCVYERKNIFKKWYSAKQYFKK